MRAPLVRRLATRVASRRIGALAFALALPACVLSEELSGLDEAASTGGTDAGGPPDTVPASSTGSGFGTSSAGDADESSTGDARGVGSDGDDETSTGRAGDAADSGSTTAREPTVFNEDCCAPSDGVGCGDPEVEACVCDLDPYCCESAWDDVCVDLMGDAGCLTCGASTQLVPDGCCVDTGEPGCADDEVSACVCAMDPFCCDVQWDTTCVGLVDEYGCGTCLPPVCCAPSTDPGCAPDPELEACVCASDSFCCESQWDNLCVSEVTTLGCGDCGWVSEGGGCCEANGTPGCDDPDIEACVCPGDPFCCQTSWDSLCADEVDTYGCGTCPVDSGSGTGESGGSDTGGGPIYGGSGSSGTG